MGKSLKRIIGKLKRIIGSGLVTLFTYCLYFAHKKDSSYFFA